jgi:sigma-B regulation protein RsbU (phosphoserine phosphatase)
MLMPKSAPVIPGLEVDARYLPAQKIGGDLYDWYVLPDGKLGLAVADVSGKGIPASLLMAICRAHLRQIAPRCASPAQCLRELQRAMEADFQPGRFITMIYAMIDPRRSELVFARAGHELPLLLSGRSGQAAGRFFDSEGISIGLADSALFDETIVDHRADFGTGDVLVVYTDGVTEAPNLKGKEFSGTRLVDNVRRCHRGSAKEINDGVLGALQTFCGEAAQRDDITLVTVKRVGEAVKAGRLKG